MTWSTLSGGGNVYRILGIGHGEVLICLDEGHEMERQYAESDSIEMAFTECIMSV